MRKATRRFAARRWNDFVKRERLTKESAPRRTPRGAQNARTRAAAGKGSAVCGIQCAKNPAEKTAPRGESGSVREPAQARRTKRPLRAESQRAAGSALPLASGAA